MVAECYRLINDPKMLRSGTKSSKKPLMQNPKQNTGTPNLSRKMVSTSLP